MDFLTKNLKYLRKRSAMTQENLATALDLKKSTYASYENDDGNTPPAKTLYAIAKKYDVSIESLFEIDYSALNNQDTLRISDREIYFPVSVDLSGTELIDVVPATHQAQAGYLSDYSDPAYIRSLPKINWDMGTYEAGTKRLFQISGDSMLPIPSQSFILGVKKSFEEVINHHTYVVITHRDILFKRLRKEGDTVHLMSDNSLFPPQRIKADQIQQYWKALKAIIEIPDPSTMLSAREMQETLQDTNEKVTKVLSQLRKYKN